MPKIKQTLKSQLTLRIYNQEDKDILDKAYNKTKSGFDKQDRIEKELEEKRKQKKRQQAEM